MKLVLMRTVTGKQDTNLPQLQRVNSFELTAPQIASAQHVGTPSRLLEKQVERMPRVYKALIKANGGYFEESIIHLDLFNTFFGFYMILCVIS
jgi:hypothetical protein